MKKIGIIGCGAIGSYIARYIYRKLNAKARIAAVCDIDQKKADSLSMKIKPRPKVMNIEELIKKSDLIIESAGVEIAGYIAKKAVAAKKDVLIMSTGGLLKYRSIFNKAKGKGGNIYIPSGALCGVDGLKSAMIGKIKKVKLTTRKPLKGLKGAALLKGRVPKDMKRDIVLFSGNAEEAVRYFPKNINVAATLSLFGIGPKKTNVRVITSGRYKKNIHELEIEGSFGRIFTRTENIPSKDNPKTSQLAIFSALAKLREVV